MDGPAPLITEEQLVVLLSAQHVPLTLYEYSESSGQNEICGFIDFNVPSSTFHGDTGNLKNAYFTTKIENGYVAQTVSNSTWSRNTGTLCVELPACFDIMEKINKIYDRVYAVPYSVVENNISSYSLWANLIPDSMTNVRLEKNDNGKLDILNLGFVSDPTDFGVRFFTLPADARSETEPLNSVLNPYYSHFNQSYKTTSYDNYSSVTDLDINTNTDGESWVYMVEYDSGGIICVLKIVLS